MHGWHGLALAAAAAAFVAGVGCIPKETQSIGAVDPASSIPAIQDAAKKKDRTAIPALVKQLGSDDPAVRFYAINALRDLTGQTLEYKYFDDAEARKPAVLRWQAWLAEHPAR